MEAMEDISKLKTLTTTAIAVGCASVSLYLIIKYGKRIKNAAEAFHYLKVKIVTNEDECEVAVAEIRRRSKLHRAIGFDCEWVTEQGKRQPVALIQLSTYDGYCALFRLNQIKRVPECLKDLLEDASIYKVGVVPLDDAAYLSDDFSVSMRSTLDLRYIAELCGYDGTGLASLTKSILHVELDKSWRVRCSDWQADVLSQRQVDYAAADAHVAIKMFVNLMNDRVRGGFIQVWLLGNRNDVWNDLDNLCQKFSDINYNFKPKAVIKTRRKNKEAVAKNRYPHATRSKPLYHNCFLHAPDGELLCTCDNKKALWYVQKELGDVVKEDPLTVRLRFEPAGRSVGDVGRYYQLRKENKCVVCGATNSYIRKNVVPREYRKYFPEIMKDHSSHDIVLLCTLCHQRSNMRDRVVREDLARRCDAPLPTHDHSKYKEDPGRKKIRSAARALLSNSRKHELPEWRHKELERFLLDQYPGHEQLTEEFLKEAAETQVNLENVDYESHGQKVVEYYSEHEGLLKLEVLWRQHFLDVMQPKFMPALWSVNHNEERMLVRLQEGRLSEENRKLLAI